MGMRKPNSKRNLDMAIRRLGKTDEEYLSNRTAITNAVVGQMLSGAVVKGGSSLKIRFGNKATRATTDLDEARSVAEGEFVQDFDQRLRDGWDGFAGRLVDSVLRSFPLYKTIIGRCPVAWKSPTMRFSRSRP